MCFPEEHVILAYCPEMFTTASYQMYVQLRNGCCYCRRCAELVLKGHPQLTSHGDSPCQLSAETSSHYESHDVKIAWTLYYICSHFSQSESRVHSNIVTRGHVAYHSQSSGPGRKHPEIQRHCVLDSGELPKSCSCLLAVCSRLYLIQTHKLSCPLCLMYFEENGLG